MNLHKAQSLVLARLLYLATPEALDLARTLVQLGAPGGTEVRTVVLAALERERACLDSPLHLRTGLAPVLSTWLPRAPAPPGRPQQCGIQALALVGAWVEAGGDVGRLSPAGPGRALAERLYAALRAPRPLHEIAAEQLSIAQEREKIEGRAASKRETLARREAAELAALQARQEARRYPVEARITAELAPLDGRLESLERESMARLDVLELPASPDLPSPGTLEKAALAQRQAAFREAVRLHGRCSRPVTDGNVARACDLPAGHEGDCAC